MYVQPSTLFMQRWTLGKISALVNADQPWSVPVVPGPTRSPGRRVGISQSSLDIQVRIVSLVSIQQ